MLNILSDYNFVVFDAITETLVWKILLSLFNIDIRNESILNVDPASFFWLLLTILPMQIPIPVTHISQRACHSFLLYFIIWNNLSIYHR